MGRVTRHVPGDLEGFRHGQVGPPERLVERVGEDGRDVGGHVVGVDRHRLVESHPL
jgi:hypothetical protein